MRHWCMPGWCEGADIVAKYGEDWTEVEIEICVRAYVEALKAGGAKKSIPKDVYLYRAIKQLPGRNDGAVARRMGNISAIMVLHGADPVVGWKPQENVGPTNTARIGHHLKVLGAIA